MKALRIVAIGVLALAALSCSQEEATTAGGEGAAAGSPAPEVALAAPVSAAPMPAAPAAPPAGTVLASQDTNWPGVVAEVTEFRRKGTTLTAKVRLRNNGTARTEPDVSYKGVYVMDADAGRKYQVLQDEKGVYIAALRPGWNDNWHDTLEAGQSFTLWMKFPAPPAEVRSVTLALPGMPPFEDLPIEDR